MLMFLMLYLLIGGAIATALMREEDGRIDEAKRFCPSYMVFIAMVIAFLVLVLIWPYVVYDAFKGEDS